MSETYTNVYFVTGGGTGGHIYPAMAIADALSEDAKVYYVGNKRNMELELATKKGYKFGGYYTEKNGTGIQMISSTGYLTNNFINTTYTSNVTLYLFGTNTATNSTS
jgi:UDP-N-acetylglucosamine:LPS N-acetylglucosamine transferase